ncbi:MAG: hypothetical protein ACJ71G_08290 [Nitrososphaeraceae archaeon]
MNNASTDSTWVSAIKSIRSGGSDNSTINCQFASDYFNLRYLSIA